MNIRISKNYLYNTLQNLGRIISSNSPQASLRGIKMEVKNDSIIFTGSDADISMQKIIRPTEENELIINETGSILIEARYLLDIVRKIDSNTITIEIIDGALTKFSGKQAEFKINGMRPHDYPNIDFSKPSKKISLSSIDLTEIIDQTTFATAEKETRLTLTGVHFDLKNNILNCIATDSYRLAKKTIPFSCEDSFSVTIPSKSLNEIKAIISSSNENNVDLYLDDKKAQFITDDMIFQTRLLDGTYPDVTRLIPTVFQSSFKMKRSELIQAIDRSIFIKTDNMPVNRLQCSETSVILHNKNMEIGEYHEELNTVFTGEPLDISFSANYVLPAVRSFNSEEIIMQFNGPMKPFVITSEEDTTLLQLVLPLRTYI